MSCAALIEDIEKNLAKVYRFPLYTSAVPFLIGEEKFVLEQEQLRPPRAAVFLSQKDEELEIGIYLEQQLLKTLAEHNPFTELNDKNLDAYCVLIEELSHFHLLVQRSQESRAVSHLELEWQGEIDKLLLAGLLMSRQRQEPCFDKLHTQIFENSTLTDGEVYEEASHYAAKCWHRLLPKSKKQSHFTRDLIPVLQTAYKASWQDKIRLIHNLK